MILPLIILKEILKVLKKNKVIISINGLLVITHKD